MYLSGDTVLIYDIGEAGFSSAEVAEARTSLVCHTINLNITCCRGGGDGNRAGDWYFPNGGLVPGNNEGLDFTRTGYTQQVRLNRRNDATTPTGVFECRVLDGDDMLLASANITLTIGVCLFVCMCRCDVFLPCSHHCVCPSCAECG